MIRLRQKGFTLLEMLLVMAIASSILVGVMNYTTQRNDELRRDRAVMQTQQVLNAGLAYYVNTSSWPTGTDLSVLQTAGYLPTGTIRNPWGQSFSIASNTTSGVFYACSVVNGKTAYASSAIIAGRLPMAMAMDGTPSCGFPSGSPCSSASTACTVIASVNIPGQNLNNARAINFAGIYHPGQCVSKPTCPGSMVAQIMVVPLSVSGINTASAAYPLTGFTAYAVGPSTTPTNCAGTGPSLPCWTTPTPVSWNGGWRVCMKIDTSTGTVLNTGTSASRADPANVALSSSNPGNPNWAKNVTVLAMTRCMPSGEGTTFSVYGDPYTQTSPGGTL